MDGWMDGIKLLAEFVMESSSRPCVLVDEMFVTEAFAAKVLGFYNACTDWCVCVCVCWGGRRAAGDIMPDDSSSSTSHLLFFFTPSQQPPRAEGKKKNKRQANGKNKRGTFTFFFIRNRNRYNTVKCCSACTPAHRSFFPFSSVFLILVLQMGYVVYYYQIV
jgi:hypothetical protein